MPKSVICPLGLLRVEETCPNAPCLACMRSLGEHIAQEIILLQNQARSAHTQAKPEVRGAIHDILRSVAAMMTSSRAPQGTMDDPRPS